MELTYTIDGVTLYTQAPEHTKECKQSEFRLSVNQYAVKWTCKNCGVFVSVERSQEQEEI